jgi:polysaccharide chain length determinant protein (PEP-CTERM system associated)
MPTTEKPFNIHDYLEVGLRRKWYIIIPLILCVLASFGVYKYLPKVYKATTLILVQPQRVPESYVQTTITDSVAGRLSTISQEILSRTRLEKVIQEFNLYSDMRKTLSLEEVVEKMRKVIEVKVQTNSQNERTQNSFSISFEDKDPKTVMIVTNKLASLFIEENLKVRESQAEGTAEFLSKELMEMDERLKEKEHLIRNFKERSMGQLPQQLDANLRILERLEQQLQTTSQNMRAVEDRSILLQNQIEQLKTRGQFSVPQRLHGDTGSGTEDMGRQGIPEDPLISQLNNLKRELASAQSKYKDTHPDVIDLKKKIANLELKVKKLFERQEAERTGTGRNGQGGMSEESLSQFTLDPNTARLVAQYTEQYNSVLLEAKRFKEETKNLKEQIGIYQKRIEDTPKREQEIALLTRDYDLLKTNYQSLMEKKIQAQMAENLERKQQGEQFKILDPARIPEKPVKPDRNKILLMGGVIGLVTGLGLVWFRESMDQSFHAVSDLEEYLGIPVIAAIPNLIEERKAA